MIEKTQPMTLYEGKFLRLMRSNNWEYVVRSNCTGVVVLIATTADNKLLLVEQFRPAVGGDVIQLPAGLVGDHPGESEDLLEAARRELLEETGYATGKVEEILSGPISSGLTNEVVTFIRATELEKRGAGGGVEHERITVHEVALDGIDEWLREKMERGKLVEPQVFAGLWLLQQGRPGV